MSALDKPVQINFTIRDAIQSNHGTNPAAHEIVSAMPNVKEYGAHSYQTSGGTFLDLPVRKNRNPFDYNKEICDHFAGTTQTALVRGDFLFAYDRKSLDVIVDTLDRMGAMGVNVLSNFNGMNDTRFMRSIAMVANKLREEKGYDMYAQGGLCVQENPNTQRDQQKILDRLYRVAETLKAQGHKDFYVKNANGVLRPDFTYELVKGLSERFDDNIHIHSHNTYGQTVENYLAAIEAGAFAVDVLPDALGEGTAQPSLGLLLHAMKNSSSEVVRSRMPVGLNHEAIAKDQDSMIMLRGTWRDNELKFNPSNLVVMEASGAAGGAASAVKGMDSIRTGLYSALNTQDWPTAQRALYSQKTGNRDPLGYPTNVTPYELMQDLQAAQDVAFGKSFRNLAPYTLDYLTGEWGELPDSVDPELQARALKARGLDSLVEIVPVEELPSGLAIANLTLIAEGILEPTSEQANIAANSGQVGVAFVALNSKKLVTGDSSDVKTGVYSKLVSSVKTPELPSGLSDGESLHAIAPIIFDLVYRSLDLQKTEAGFYKGVENLDGRAQELRGQIAEQRSNIIATLRESGLKDVALGRALKRVNAHIIQVGANLGVEPKYSGEFDIFSNRVLKKSDLVNVFGEQSVKSAAQLIVSGQADRVSEEFSRVNSIIQESDLLHMQKVSAVELFNSMLADTVKGSARVKGVTLPERLPELKLTEIRDEVFDEVGEDQFLNFSDATLA